MRQEGGAILLGREQHEVGHALGHHGRDLNQIVGPALDVLSYEAVDGGVEAVGHRSSQAGALAPRHPSPEPMNEGDGGCAKPVVAGPCQKWMLAPCSG